MEGVFKCDGQNWIGTIEHIQCQNLPLNLKTKKKFNQDDFIEVYEKAMAKYRYEIWQIIKGTDPRGNEKLQR